MRKIMIACAVVAMMLTQTAAAQDNNSSIGEDLKKVWGDPGAPSGTGMDMDGMYDTQAGTEDTDDINFNDNVVSSLPIDGGLSLLLAAGVVVGARRIKREVNKSKEKTNNLAK
jgi:hypothetical protein